VQRAVAETAPHRESIWKGPQVMGVLRSQRAPCAMTEVSQVGGYEQLTRQTPELAKQNFTQP